MTISDITKQTGISGGTIASLFERMGIRPRGYVAGKCGMTINDYSEYQVEKMKKRYDEIQQKHREEIA